MTTNKTYLKKTSLIFLFSLFFYTSLIFSQEKGIVLKDKTNNEIEFLKENKRIKIFTLYGQKITGRFKIINDNTIQIDGENILLESIIKIKRRSVGSAILETTFYFLGGVIVSVSIIAATVNPLALIVLPFSFPFIGVGILIPELENSHKLKRWSYCIGLDEPKTD